MEELIYGYTTQSKLISLEYMLASYCDLKSQELFQWRPEVCIIYRDNTRWRVYYDEKSVNAGQTECKKIFDNRHIRLEIFNRIQEIIDGANVIINKISIKNKLSIDIISDYINYMKSFLQYYSFSNEFIFSLVEKEVKEKLSKSYNDIEIKDILFKIDGQLQNEEDEAINSRCSSIFLDGNIINLLYIDLIEDIRRLRLLRFKMRERMVSVNNSFYSLLKKELRLMYSDILADDEIEKVISNIKLDELNDIASVKINNVLMRDIKGLYCVNRRVYINERESCNRLLNKKSIIKNEYVGVLVFGTGTLNGKVRKKFFEGGNGRNKIYVTKSLHPKDMIMFKEIDAILVDEGGVLSHAGIIANELKIPCLTNLVNLSENVQEGDSLEIDFQTGKVKVLHSDLFNNRNVHNQIIELNNGIVDKDRFGNKCINLCRHLISNHVIPGYVLETSLVEEIAVNWKAGNEIRLTKDDEIKMQEMFPIILRSSSNYEDDDNFTGAGFFESISDINSLEDFYKSIEIIYDSSKSSALKAYLDKKGNTLKKEITIAIIAQKYIDFDYFVTVLIENRKVKLDIVERNGQRWDVVEMVNSRLEDYSCDNLFFRTIWYEIKNIVSKENESLLELGIKDHLVYCLQIRKFGGR